MSEISNEGVVIFDFYADWCNHCKMMDSIIDSIKDLGYVVKKYNADEDVEEVSKYNIRNLPTFVILKDNIEVDRIVGATPFQLFKNKLEKYV